MIFKTRLAAPRRTAATAAAFTSRHRTSFIYDQRSAHQLFAMACIHGTLSRAIIVDLNKPESPSLTGEAIPHYGHRVNGHTVIGKEIL